MAQVEQIVFPTIDAFGRQRVSNPFTVFDSKQLSDNAPLFWSEKLEGGASASVHSTVNAESLMTVSSSGEKITRQTKMRFNYQPGKSQLYYFTFRAPDVANVKQQLGVFDDNNGIYLENDGGTYSWNIKKNGFVTETKDTTKWDENEQHKDEINLNATQIGVIDWEWLGTGTVRVGFIISGRIIYTHTFDHANDTNFTSVYMSTPNLPFRYYIESTGGTGTLQHICTCVISEGGLDPSGVDRAVDMGLNTLSIGAGIIRPLVAIRLKDSHIGSTVNPVSLSVLASSSADYLWTLSLNPVWEESSVVQDWESTSFTSVADSAVEAKTNFTTNSTITNRDYVLKSGYVSGDLDAIREDVDTILRIGEDLAGIRDVLVLSAGNFSGNESFVGGLGWNELN